MERHNYRRVLDVNFGILRSVELKSEAAFSKIFQEAVHENLKAYQSKKFLMLF